MSRIPNDPPDDIFKIVLVPLKPFLVDLPSGATVGMRHEQEGWPGVMQEIISNQKAYGDRAGITATDYTRFVTLNDQYAQILVQLPRMQKALEVLVESLAHVDNLRHRLVTHFANSAESHADAEGKDPTLRTAYEKTIAYRGIIADKAAKTRKKNEEDHKVPGGATGGSGAAAGSGAAGTHAATTGSGQGVSRIPNPPPDDIFTIDLNPLSGFLVDLPPGAMVGMRREQEGWQPVVQEITDNQKAYGDRAGITDTDFNRFVALNDQYAQILAQLPLVEKAVEVLTESLAQIDDQRHKLATQFADSAESHAKAEGGDPTLLTAYEKTIAYRSVIADKAAKTRKKNEEAKKALAGGTGGSGPAAPAAPGSHTGGTP